MYRDVLLFSQTSKLAIRHVPAYKQQIEVSVAKTNDCSLYSDRLSACRQLLRNDASLYITSRSGLVIPSPLRRSCRVCSQFKARDTCGIYQAIRSTCRRMQSIDLALLIGEAQLVTCFL